MASLIVEEHSDRVLVRLDRPERGNAIDADIVEELHRVCSDLEERPRIALFAGEGRMFAAGADIAQLRDRKREDALRGINSRLFDRINRLPMPTIALLHGHVLGGGAELAYACDFRICSEDVRIGNPETGLGIVAAAGATWRLAELVGEPLAKRVVLAGEILNADQSLASGLVSQVVAAEDLLSAGHALADRIAQQSPVAVRLSKTLLAAPRAAHPMVDELAQAILFEDAEKYRRMTAFLERRERR